MNVGQTTERKDITTCFRIGVTERNGGHWTRACLDSVSYQAYRGEYDCIIVDDASTDDTASLIAGHPLLDNGRATLLRNEVRLGGLANYVRIFSEFANRGASPTDVYITIDGDDWLFSPLVLDVLDQTYSTGECWMTWGSYVEWPTGRLKPGVVLPEAHCLGDYRSRPWVTSHLRTFRSHLWHSIRDRDLRDDTGHYFDTAWDLAFMFPMLEMSRERARLVPTVTYVYNVATPDNDFKLRRQEQRKSDCLIRARAPYERKADAIA